MFKFGDRVKCICYNDAKTEGLIMATTEDYAFVMFEIKQDTVLNAGFEYKCDIYFDNTNYTYAYNIPVKYLQEVEPEKSQHNNDNCFGDRIAVAVDGKIIYNSDNSINSETNDKKRKPNKLHVKPTKPAKIIKQIFKYKKNGVHVKTIKVIEENSFVPHEVDLDE